MAFWNFGKRSLASSSFSKSSRPYWLWSVLWIKARSYAMARIRNIQVRSSQIGVFIIVYLDQLVVHAKDLQFPLMSSINGPQSLLFPSEGLGAQLLPQLWHRNVNLSCAVQMPSLYTSLRSAAWIYVCRGNDHEAEAEQRTMNYYCNEEKTGIDHLANPNTILYNSSWHQILPKLCL